MNIPDKTILETEEQFQQKMEKGYSDMLNGRVTPLAEAIAEIKKLSDKT